MHELPYNRTAAVEYARKWALTRNPAFYDFEEIGGDCTNFASQCIYAGSGVMNYTPVMGWYYNSPYDRTPSWSGVEYLYNFLITNKSVGPYAKIVPAHTYDALDRPLSSYIFDTARFLHIEGARTR